MSTNEKSHKLDLLLEALRNRGIMRTGDIVRVGISREYLRKLTQRGIINKSGRGLYYLPDFDPSEHHSIVEAAVLIPRGVICLLSALQFHSLTTQMPYEIWVGI